MGSIVHVLDVLEAVAEIADEGMVDMLEHAAFADDVPYALGSYNCGKKPRQHSDQRRRDWMDAVRRFAARRTFIFPYVFQSKGQAGVLALDDANLSEGASADDTQESEMVEVHYRRFLSAGVRRSKAALVPLGELCG